LQYILGETEFMSLPFRVTPDVLIPRPETETLVGKTLIELGGRSRVRILDAGSGSGAVGISLAHALHDARVVCADVDPAALEIGRENAHRNGVADRVRFIRADMTGGDFAVVVQGPFDALVSNPPYVSAAEWPTLPPDVRVFEPRRALYGGEDGLDFYRALIRHGPAVLRDGGLLLLEVGAGQAPRVADMMVRAGFAGVESTPDLNGIPRVVRAVPGSRAWRPDTES
jgi:release factor glutamine methyltransferase